MEENKQNSNKLYYLIGGLGSILLGGGIYYLVKNNIFFIPIVKSINPLNFV